jgi:hypothetical protein
VVPVATIAPLSMSFGQSGRSKSISSRSKGDLQMRFVMFILLIPFYPEAAYAYVDPGFITALYQLAYVLIFGVLATFILNPWRSLKTWFLSVFCKKQCERPGEAQKKNKN